MANFSPLSGSPTSVNTPSESITATVSIPTTTLPQTNPNPKPKPASKPRKRVNTAEKRSQHNAIERARRETLNAKFLSLARLLPSLASSRRPSKSAIVNGSIAHLNFQRNQRILAAKLLKQAVAERDELLNEVNEWRKVNGYAPKEAQSSWIEEMEEIADVEKEIFGSFASMGGDGDENDDDEMANESFEAATNISAGNGLITPRSSTELESNPAVQNLYNHAQAFAERPATAATLNSIDWSAEFGFGLNNAAQVNSAPSRSNSMMYGSASSSPTNQGPSTVLTPATSTIEAMYTHTPSPASSHSINGPVEAKSEAQSQVTPLQFTHQQFAYLQQMQQAQLHRQSHQQQPFNPMAGNTFNTMFGQVQQAQQQSMNPMVQSDAFTQQLIASMFPQQNKYPNLGNGGGQTPASLADIEKAIRAGVGLGLELVNGSWSQPQNPAVEGF
ncbi:hypothetical protein CI109_100801 [Kwoniella shandongensis]|uniref:Uncharacterized protein n=1 Tax=Kwoniella shandongensis TaxID=1734106 RepID=A0A5M6BWV3_9TREE|nr:uncharacterized protein CI109_005020 [Kwoniella shandongensis]KAA5526630.1 hypothetical protein CI109_005020 [Kwoniella shandongensis]